MGMPNATKMIQRTVSADSSTYSTVLEGPLMLCYGADNLQIAGILRGTAGNLGVKTTYRTFTARREMPEAWTDFGSPITAPTNGQFAGTQSLSGVTGRMWIQGGIAAAASSGLGQGDASLQCFAESKARVITAQKFEIEPDTNSTKTAIFEFGPPFPSLGVSGFMVAGALYGINGTLKLNFCIREFVSDPKWAGAWGSGLITEYTTTANGDYNSGNVAVSQTSGNSLMQVGVMTPANDARAMLDLVLAVKY